MKGSNPAWPRDFRLPRWGQFLAVAVNLCLGFLPGGVAFFTWIEQNCSLPWVGHALRWPIFRISEGMQGSEFYLAFMILWNLAMFFVFGFLHSLVAQKSVQGVIESVLPPQLIRTFFLCTTGVSLLWMMATWQPTGIILWTLPLDPILNQVLSVAVFWIFMLTAGRLLTRFGAAEFVGLKQVGLAVKDIQRTEGTSHLIVTGMYRWVRHPVYTFTLLAFFITPVMSLDRFLITLATAAYLVFGIPIEERKLVRQFGKAYLDYRERVPAVIPFLR